MLTEDVLKKELADRQKEMEGLRQKHTVHAQQAAVHSNQAGACERDMIACGAVINSIQKMLAPVAEQGEAVAPVAAPKHRRRR